MALEERFAKALRKKARRGFKGYPVATVAFYGPDNSRASKVAVGIIAAEGQDPDPLERWFSETGDVRSDVQINQQILRFVEASGARSVAMFERIIGCPHEEGIDYPEGDVCPQCPYWAHRNRFTGEVDR